MPGRSLISLISTIFWRLRASAAFFCSVKRIFAVIEDFADRGIGVGHDLHQIEPVFFRQAQSFDNVDHPAILAFRIDQLDLADANFPVGAGSLLLRNRGGFHGTTNGVFSLDESGDAARRTLLSQCRIFTFSYSKNPRDRNHEDRTESKNVAKRGKVNGAFAGKPRF